jgi:hypothetical protein
MDPAVPELKAAKAASDQIRQAVHGPGEFDFCAPVRL